MIIHKGEIKFPQRQRLRLRSLLSHQQKGSPAWVLMWHIPSAFYRSSRSASAEATSMHTTPTSAPIPEVFVKARAALAALVAAIGADQQAV
jgi:hypothetical protein